MGGVPGRQLFGSQDGSLDRQDKRCGGLGRKHAGAPRGCTDRDFYLDRAKAAAGPRLEIFDLICEFFGKVDEDPGIGAVLPQVELARKTDLVHGMTVSAAADSRGGGPGGA